MSKLKEISVQSTIAWSPNSNQPDLLAAGTVSGTIGADFDTSSKLDIYSLGIQNNSTQPSLKGSITVNNRFNDLAWTHASGSSHGLIAGAMDNGLINLWDASRIINGESEALLGFGQCQGTVNSIDINSIQTNLIASAGSNSDNNVLVWNFVNPSAPTTYIPGERLTNCEVTCIRWNSKLPQIMGATLYSGNILVWDLRHNRQLMNFGDKSRRCKYMTMVWNPNESTHLITASEDDNTPVIQSWDLKNTHAPVKTLEGHTKGIWGLSWSTFDRSLLLSSGKDNRTLCWNIDTGDVLCEVAGPESSPSDAPAHWNFDVQWSPRIPGLLATSSFSGSVNVYSLQDVNARSTQATVNSMGITEPAKKTVLKHTPKWLQRPCGAAFGFGGKLVSFNKKSGNKIQIVKVSTEKELLERSQNLEATIVNGTYSEYCEEKINAATNEDEKSIWTFLKLLFSGNERKQILNHLGYDIETVKAELQKFISTLPEVQTSSIVKSEETNSTEEQSQEDSELKKSAEAMSNLFINTNGNTEDFNISPSSSVSSSVPATPLSPIHFPESGNENMITKALMIGDYQLAIDSCLRLGRLSDALILAHAAGPTFWKSTQDAYFDIVKSPFSKVVSCIVKKDFGTLVGASELSDWKATLSVLCTYAPTTVFRNLAGHLGDRLENESNDSKSAILCYICAGDIDKTVNLWNRINSSNAKNSTTDLQSFIERVVIFRNSSQASANSPLNDVLALKYSKYAELLASQGNLQSSLRYLSLLPNNPTSAVLFDRVYHATNQHGNIPVPPFPFQFVMVGGKGHQNPTPTNNVVRPPTTMTSSFPPTPSNYQPPSNAGSVPPPQPPMNKYNPPTTTTSFPPGPSMMSFNQQAYTNPTNQFTPPNMTNTYPPPPNPSNQFNQPPPPPMGNMPPTMNTFTPVGPSSQTNQPPPMSNVPTMNTLNPVGPPPSSMNPPTMNTFTPMSTGTSSSFNPGPPPPMNTFIPGGPMYGAPTPSEPLAPPPIMPSHHHNKSTDTSPKNSDIFQPVPKPNVHNSTSIPGTPTLEPQLNVDSQLVVDNLRVIYERIQKDPRYQQVLDEINKKINNTLVAKIQKGDLSAAALTALQIVIKSIVEDDFKNANEKYIQLTSSYWNDIGSQSMTGLKRIIDIGLRK